MIATSKESLKSAFWHRWRSRLKYNQAAIGEDRRVAKKMKKTAHKAVEALHGSARRMIVTYVDGGWTDNLAIRRYDLAVGEEGLLLTIDVSPRERVGKAKVAREAYRDFVVRRRKLHVIQIGKPTLRTQLRKRMKQLENQHMEVRLSANGGPAVSYPVAIVLGPDEVILNLG
jgi:hypothetical protein